MDCEQTTACAQIQMQLPNVSFGETRNVAGVPEAQSPSRTDDPLHISAQISVPFAEDRIYDVVDRLGIMVVSDSMHAMTERNSSDKLHFFSVEEEIRYFPFCDDFGPFNLGAIFRFLTIVRDKLDEMPSKTLVLCCPNEKGAVTNHAFILGAYLILELGYDAESQFMPLCNVHPSPFVEFRDATFGPVSFGLHIRDAWRGLAKAASIGWFDIGNEHAFDMEEYDHYDNPGNGDLHFVVPNKIIAFKGPTDDIPPGNTWYDNDNIRTFHPTFYVDVFQEMGVECIVRVNAEEYDAECFRDKGIEHVDLYFCDCTVPPPHIVLRFLELVQRSRGVIAVHCKAGLGRTGTLIALYLMKCHRFTAREAIGFLRIGSIIGIQQQFLVDQEDTMQKADITAFSPLTKAELEALAWTQEDSLSEMLALCPLEGQRERELLGKELLRASNRRSEAVIHHWQRQHGISDTPDLAVNHDWNLQAPDRRKLHATACPERLQPECEAADEHSHSLVGQSCSPSPSLPRKILQKHSDEHDGPRGVEAVLDVEPQGVGDVGHSEAKYN